MVKETITGQRPYMTYGLCPVMVCDTEIPLQSIQKL